MHKALAFPTDDPAFSSEPLTIDDMRSIAQDAKDMAQTAFARMAKLDKPLNEDMRGNVERLLSRQDECFGLIDALVKEPIGAIKTRVHGDYHLGQVLVVKDDVMIIDFEGEPSRSLEHRRAKTSSLRDVAGMLRSFAYAIATARKTLARRVPDATLAVTRLTEELGEFSKIFVDAYLEAARGSAIWIEDSATRHRLLSLFLLSKAFYEIDYEAGNRPDWIDIPIEGVLDILDRVAETA